MQKFLVPFAILAVLTAGALTAYAATREQALVAAVMYKLGLDSQVEKGPDGKVLLSGPQKWRITQNTIDLLTKHKGKDIIINSDGSIYLPGEKVPEDKGDGSK